MPRFLVAVIARLSVFKCASAISTACYITFGYTCCTRTRSAAVIWTLCTSWFSCSWCTIIADIAYVCGGCAAEDEIAICFCESTCYQCFRSFHTYYAITQTCVCCSITLATVFRTFCLVYVIQTRATAVMGTI